MLPPIKEAGGGGITEKERARLREIIERVNDLFEGELTDEDKLTYVNEVIKRKLMESEVLREQATHNTRQQFGNSPDLEHELVQAIISALDAHTTMSTQALNSDLVRQGLKDILLKQPGLYESLRNSQI